MNFKKTFLYRELRFIYLSSKKHGRGFSYIYHKFVLGPKIKKLKDPIDISEIDKNYSIHLLCGHGGVTMLLWSLASWYAVVPRSGQVFVHEDGSFTAEDRKLVQRLLPKSKIVDFSVSSELAEKKWLAKYPAARQYRQKAIKDKLNIFAVKLIDPRFVGESRVKLILDTDLLWFREPVDLLNHLRQGKFPFAMNVNTRDLRDEDRMDFVFKDGSVLEPNITTINSGIVGYDSENFKIEDLEKFCAQVGDSANPHFTEQAGYAWVLSRGQDFFPLPNDTYHIKGPVSDLTVMKHYTNPRREYFWNEGVQILSKIIL